MSFILTSSLNLTFNEPIKDILYDFPNGVIIIAKETTFPFISPPRIIFANNFSRKLIGIPNDNDIVKFMKKLSTYREYNPLMMKSLSLKEVLFASKAANASKIFISSCSKELLYVKIKFTETKILLSIDDLQEERKLLQTKFIKNVNYHYLLTLYHEINNPLNSLIASVYEIINGTDSIIIIAKRIDLLIFLIQFFLKNFILYFQVSIITNNEIASEEDSTFNLESLIKTTSTKFTMLFEHKKLNYQSCIDILTNKATTMNYFYFKTLIKMIFTYFYHKLEKGSSFYTCVEKINESNLRLFFTNEKSDEMLLGHYGIFNEGDSNDNNADTRDDFDYYARDSDDDNYDTDKEMEEKDKIQTLDMVLATIVKLSELLNVNFGKTDNENGKILITLIIPYENDFKLFDENDYREFLPEQQPIRAIQNINHSVSKISIMDLDNYGDMRNKTFNDYSPICNKSNITNMTTQKEIRQTLSPIVDPYNKKNTHCKTNLLSKKMTAYGMTLNLHSDQYKKIRTVIGNSERVFMKNSSEFNEFNFNKVKNKYKGTTSPFNIQCMDSIDDSKFKSKAPIEDKLSSFARIKTTIHEFGESITRKIIPKNTTKNNQSCITIPIKKKPFKNYQFEQTNNTSVFNYEEDIKNSHNIKTDALIAPIKKQSNVQLKYPYSQQPNIAYESLIGTSLNTPVLKTKPSFEIKKATSLHSCNCNDILLVDDEPFNISCYSNILSKQNIKSDSANDGKECLEKIINKSKQKCHCKKSSYKIVLLDIIMPKVGGLETAEEIMKLVKMNVIPQTISIIFISACSDKEKSIDAVIRKIPIIKAFLPKPLKKQKIEELLLSYYYS